MTSPYIGRFAPTPSGLLHFGSLVAALASYLDARHAGGQWLLRIEDLDQTRSQPDAERQILQALEDFGLEHDGEIVRQSERLDLYRAQTERWLAQGLAYYCDCPRRTLLQHGPVYPGTCSTRQLSPAADHAVRLRVNDTPITCVDRLQLPLTQNLAHELGDFIVRRRDGVYAYQLAVVLDDIQQGITDVVRGADLLDSTPRQMWLYHLLNQSVPRYLHVPLIMREDGEKLSKRLASEPLQAAQAPQTMWRALRALAQPVPEELRGASVQQQLAWATPHWQPQRLPSALQIMQHSLPG
ncbi:tRNA glutamyl-Q(34) synthetase GluQRS [Halopseudomonas maritima]|uniref:tRNA glutamyl-Q(34) synthetase GluQRS n=1 Tax=Halopseudomonas maritima TaxID=2918528 RepID=UPI001EE9E3D3|nr:tRNA glutamyl-Q(34) synthetase GluQRS [Halopseudomonas maritima]UJJ30465.1 tRNA glutamyl-Q(34) synthetase GluQRS [Halopseudomonas maritima]